MITNSCQMFMYVGQCSEKGTTFPVKACKQIFRRRQLDEHLWTYALRHARQIDGEMQKLKHMVYQKVMALLHVYTVGQ